MSLRTPRRLHLLALLVFWITAGIGVAAVSVAAPARSTARPSARATPDSARDESGFKVRVVEEGKGKRTSAAIPTPPDESTLPEAKPEPPDVPDAPDTPDTPDGDHGNDLVRFGEDITIPAGKVVEGDVVAIGGDVTVLGRVKGDVVSVGGAVEVKGSGAIEGDAVSLGGGVSTSDSASVTGSNVSVGTMRFWKGWGMFPMLGIAGAVGFGAWLASTLVKLILTLFFAWIALLLWKDGLLRASTKMHDQFGKSFLWGLLTMAGLVVAIPVGIIALILLCFVAVVILCITIIGIPVAVLLLVALVIAIVALVVGVVFAMFLGYLNGVLYLGQRVLGSGAATRSPLFLIAVGMVLIALLGLAGHLAGFVGFMLFNPLSIAFGIAARALAFILTVAGLGAVWLSFIQGGGIAWGRSYNWGSFRSRGDAGGSVPPTPPSPPPPSPPIPPAQGGTSDSP